MIVLLGGIFIILYACIQHYRQCPDYKKYTLKKYYYGFYVSAIMTWQFFIMAGLWIGNIAPVISKRIFIYIFIVVMTIMVAGFHGMSWSFEKIAETAIPYFEKERSNMKTDKDKLFNEYLIDTWRSKKYTAESSKTELKVIDASAVILVILLLT